MKKTEHKFLEYFSQCTDIYIRIAGVGNDSYIYYWQCKGLSNEKINSIKMPNHIISPNLDYYGIKTRVELNGGCLETR